MRTDFPAHRPAWRVILATLVAALAPAGAYAHPGHDLAQGVVGGLLHPWTSPDHLLLLLGAGLLAARMRQRPGLALPFALAALCCVLHGYAHALDTPNYFVQPAFTVGFVTSMFTICLLGVAIAVRFWRQPVLILGAGASCAVTGFALLSLN